AEEQCCAHRGFGRAGAGCSLAVCVAYRLRRPRRPFRHRQGSSNIDRTHGMMATSNLCRAGLDAIHFSGAAKLLAPVLRGIGAIFMLHHVLPSNGGESGFAPNAMLEVTPEFLDAVISHVKRAGYRLVSLEEAIEVVKRGGDQQPVAVFTLDDGYRDNLIHAWPVFRAHRCPFTIFVAPDI